MTPEQRLAAIALKSLLPVQGDEEGYVLEDATMEDVVNGDASFQASHGGCEVHYLQDIFQKQTRGQKKYVINQNVSKRDLSVIRKFVDYRTRRDRKAREEAAFDLQIDTMAKAYMDWSLNHAENNTDSTPRYLSVDDLPEGTTGYQKVMVIDVYSQSS